MKDCQEKVYGNRGNPALLKLVAANSRVLDCGCGTGDNARHLKLRVLQNRGRYSELRGAKSCFNALRAGLCGGSGSRHSG